MFASMFPKSELVLFISFLFGLYKNSDKHFLFIYMLVKGQLFSGTQNALKSMIKDVLLSTLPDQQKAFICV